MAETVKKVRFIALLDLRRRREDDCRLGRLGDRFGSRRIGCITRLGEIGAFHGVKLGRAAGDLVCGVLDAFAHEPHAQRRTTEAEGERLRRLQRFERGFRQGAVRFGMDEKENGLHVRKKGQFLIHSTISRAISSAGASLTMRVSRSCFGRATLQ